MHDLCASNVMPGPNEHSYILIESWPITPQKLLHCKALEIPFLFDYIQSASVFAISNTSAHTLFKHIDEMHRCQRMHLQV